MSIISERKNRAKVLEHVSVPKCFQAQFVGMGTAMDYEQPRDGITF